MPFNLLTRGKRPCFPQLSFEISDAGELQRQQLSPSDDLWFLRHFQGHCLPDITRNIDCQTKRKHVGWIRASGLYSHSAESSVGARQLRWEKERWNLSKFLTRVLPYILDFHVSYAYRACVEFRRQVCRRRFCPIMWVAGSRPRFTGLAAGAFARWASLLVCLLP